MSIRDKVFFVPGDVRNREDWITGLAGQEVVVHLAAEPGTGQSMYEIELYADVNMLSTALLLDILTNHSHSLQRFVAASLRSIYGEGRYHCATHGTVFPLARSVTDMEQGDFYVKCLHCNTNAELLATTEDSQIYPSLIYGITKQDQEQMILTIGAALTIPSVALRYHNVYGLGQSLTSPYTGILSISSTRIKNDNEIVIFEEGKENHDFVFIDDVVDAAVASIEILDSGRHVVNVGSDVRTSVLEVARSMISAYGAQVSVRASWSFRLGDVRDNCAGISKECILRGFEPKIDFQTGIRLFANWVESHGVKIDAYETIIA